MQIEMILMGDSLFLTFILVILMLVLSRKNGHEYQSNDKVKEDIEKIKDQIYDE